MVRDLLQGFIDDPWLARLDFSTLELVNGHYISEDLRNRADDVVWRVKADERWVYLYLLIEFQSRVDRFMALRMLVYVGLLYEDLARARQLGPDGLLPPVLPIVLYNGEPHWKAPTALDALLPQVPAFLAPLQPSMCYLLIDEGACAPETFARLPHNLVAAIFQLEQPHTLEGVQRIVAEVESATRDPCASAARLRRRWRLLRRRIRGFRRSRHVRVGAPEGANPPRLRHFCRSAGRREPRRSTPAPPPAISQPHRIPMRILADPRHQAGAQRVGDDVAGEGEQIVLLSHSTIVESPLPALDLRHAQFAVHRGGGVRLETPDQARQIARGQFDQPVQMIGHQHVRKCPATPGLVAAPQRVHDRARDAEVREQRHALGRHSGQEIDSAGFGVAAGA